MEKTTTSKSLFIAWDSVFYGYIEDDKHFVSMDFHSIFFFTLLFELWESEKKAQPN